MGQYYKGNKIGTCESMYYMTLSEARELALMGERDDDGIKFSDYLEDNATMWRFEFPSESKENRYNNHDKSFMVYADEFVDIGHEDKWIGQSINGTHNVNIKIPCPYSEEFKQSGIETSRGGFENQPILLVRFQAIRDGEEKTIFECARCGQLQRFSSVDVERIKSATLEHYEIYKPKIGIDGVEIGGNKALYEYAQKVVELLK